MTLQAFNELTSEYIVNKIRTKNKIYARYMKTTVQIKHELLCLKVYIWRGGQR